MNADNTIIIKKSFSIENILSKPDTNKCQLKQSIICDNQNSSNAENTISNKSVVPKSEPITDSHAENFDENRSLDEESKRSRLNNFTSPDSSGCEEEIVDNLSDITSEENRRFYCQFYYYLINYNPTNQRIDRKQ